MPPETVPRFNKETAAFFLKKAKKDKENTALVQFCIDKALSFRVGANEYFIPFGQNIDTQAEREKLEKELKYNKGFLAAVQKKLSNERFVNNAPEQVIMNERKKEADALAKIEVIERNLNSL